MSTIDKASLIQIPSGYKNGKLYSVKPTPSYGSELAVNGDFTTDSDWTKGSGWTIVNGEAVHTGSGDYIEQGSLVQGTKYRVVIVVTQASASAFPQIYMGGLTTAMQSPNTYTFDITAQSGDKIKLRGLFDCKVDSISVKEILVADGDFDFSRSSSATRVNSEGLIETAQIIGSELMPSVGVIVNLGGSTITQISGNSYSSTSDGTSGSTVRPKFDFNTTSGKTYKLVITPIGTITGTINFDFYDGTTYLFQNYDFTTTKEIYFTDNGSVFGAFDGTQTYSISNFTISVKEVIENDVPRLDYSGGASCASLLLEGQSTNTVTYSEDFSQWNQTSSPTLTSGQLAPDGTLGATKISGTLGSSNIALGVSSSTTATRSIYARTVSGTGTAKLMSYYGNTNNLFTLTEEWQRFELTGSSSTGGTNFYIDFRDSSQTLSEFIIWGAQSEELSYATSYIPSNSGSQTTRTADVCNNAGTSATFNSEEGVLFAEIAALANDGTYRMISLSDGTATNRISFFYQNSPSNTIAVESAGSGTNLGIYNQNLIITNSNKIAVKYKANDCALWVNGVEIATDTSFAAFSSGTFTKLSFDRGDGINDFYGKTKQLMVFDEALSDEELSDLTGQVNLSFNNLATFYGYTIL